MKRIVTTAVLAFTVFAGLFAQSTEPETPEIILPEVILELESLPGEESETLVPEETKLYEPELEAELPDPQELEISDDLVDIPLMDMDTATAANANSFYAEGIIGLGLVNHFIGDLTLYKLGLAPRFRIHILHETLDGFQGNEAGTGFFKRTDLLDIQLSHKTEKFKAETSINYLEKETGLQEQGNFYSRIQRFYDASTDFEFSMAGKLKFLTGADIGYLSMDLTGATSDIVQEFTALPNIAMELRGENSFLKADLLFRHHQYFDNADDPLDDTLKFKLGGGWEFKNGLSLSADAGVSWVLEDDIFFPFTVNIKGNFGNSGSFKISGGFTDLIPRWLDLYKLNPYLYESGLAGREMNWFAKADTTFKLSAKLQAKIQVDFSSISNKNIPDYDDFDAVTGLYGLTTVDGMFLTAGVEAEYKYNKIFTFTLGWKSQILEDKDPFFPEHSLTFSSTISAPKENIGMSAKLLWWINEEVDFPELALSAFYKITDGMRLVVEGQDVLAPLFEDGRILYGDYIEPGVILTIKTQISL
ncbi:MAG: hypothetical protein JW874_15680 [Spirochaetales bacterium]|nr:hypothetical protein [Spirochaetales bacterium]